MEEGNSSVGGSGGKRCVLEISELEFMRINEAVRAMRQGKQMSKLSREILLNKIDKNFKSDLSFINGGLSVFNEFAEMYNEVLRVLEDRNKAFRELEIRLKQKSEEGDKYKSQLASVLKQFKAEREKNAAKVAELEGVIKKKEREVEDVEKAKVKFEQEKNSKVEETIKKMFEKNSEISKQKEELEARRECIKELEKKLATTEASLRNVLSFEQDFKVQTRIVSDNTEMFSTVKEAKLSFQEAQLEKPETRDTPSTIYSLLREKKLRTKIFKYLGIVDLVAVKTSSLLLYRIVSLDFSLVRAVEFALRKSFSRKLEVLQNSAGRTLFNTRPFQEHDEKHER